MKKKNHQKRKSILILSDIESPVTGYVIYARIIQITIEDVSVVQVAPQAV